MTRSLVFTLLLALALALGATPSSAQPAGRGAAGAGQARPERILWWNSPGLAEKLSLSDTQRQKMDTAWASFEATVKDRSKPGDARTSYQEALEAGRWDDARKALKQVADSARVPVQARGELKITVLELLTAEQRGQLATDYPMLMRQPWSPRANWSSRPRPPAGRQGGGAAQKPD